MLVDAETGMPPWYPMLFITTQLRNDGQSVATMEAAPGAIQVLLDFSEARGMDLEERLLKREFLATHEIDALCDAAQHRRKRRGRDGATVSDGHYYKRLTYIAQYRIAPANAGGVHIQLFGVLGAEHYEVSR